MSRDVCVEERYELVSNRIHEIAAEKEEMNAYAAYFRCTAQFLDELVHLQRKIKKGWLRSADLRELQNCNKKLYADILPENYEKSYGNPTYAVKQVGEEYGQLFSFLYTELRGGIAAVFEGSLWDFTVELELFVEIYVMFQAEEVPTAKELQECIYWYLSDYSEKMVGRRVQESVDPTCSFATDIIMGADLSDPKYLYQFGEYISKNEWKTAEFLDTLPQAEIDAMAHTFTEGYRIGFLNTGKDLSKKKVVNIRYSLGFERMIRAAILQFKELGLRPTIYRAAVHAVNKRQQSRIGYSGGIPNKQYDYDHRGDAALYLDQELVQRKLRVLQVAYETYQELADVHGGPAVVEIFGEEPFTPLNKPENPVLSKAQQKLQVLYDNEAGQIINRYIKGEERSFTIIAYPIPEIGAQFSAIFKETVKINTLDYQLYANIQQTIIDALDQGEFIHVKGRGQNETDLQVHLHRLANPEKETNFENCVADVNIPVGEVFTSPVLAKTNGVLHVSQVYLNELCYKNLKMTFTDGMVTAYTCSNFDTEEENQNYLLENVLYHHETLPMGEFAIGTNTTAYVMAKKYQIEDKLPILIAEKMGPHFALGDTCYSWSEDTPVYNPNGKEIIARDNEISLLRKEEIGKAYLGCHTDITIPYEELERLYVIKKDGSQIDIIKEARFVLLGTEELNKAFEVDKK